MIEIPLNRASPRALYRQIADHLESMILAGTLPSSWKLPGSRELASSLGVSRTTVTESYECLAEKGLIVLKGRSGAYVADGFLPAAREHQRSLVHDLAEPFPSSDLLPTKQLHSAVRATLAQAGAELYLPLPPEGLLALRVALMQHAAARGIPAHHERIAVTSGALEGLFLSLSALRNAGIRRLWVESLTYPNVFTIAASLGLEVHSLPHRPEKYVEGLARAGSSDVVYLIPSFHNPTGRTLPYAIRRDLLALSAERGLWVLEDDAYGELRYGDFSVPALKALPLSERVLYIGSFSQLLFPGLRLGYALLPEDLFASFVNAKAMTGSTPSLVQYVVSTFLQEGRLQEGLTAARETVAHTMQDLAHRLGGLSGISFRKPLGGIYLWIETPGREGEQLVEAARKRGVAVVPGSRFAGPGHHGVEGVRLAVSNLRSQDVADAAERLGDALEDLR